MHGGPDEMLMRIEVISGATTTMRDCDESDTERGCNAAMIAITLGV